MAKTVAVTETPAVVVAPAAAPAKPVSEKVLAKRAAAKALRAIPVDIDSPGVTIASVTTFSKKPGSHAAKVVALYAEGKLVAKVLEEAAKLDFEKAEGYARACFLYDVRHGFITLSKPEPKKA